MRAGGGFRVALQAEDGFGFVAEALNRAVEQRAVRNFDVAWQAFIAHHETVVLRSNNHFAGFQIFHRMVGAAMSLRHFFGFTAKRDAQQLMAKADAENRQSAIDQFFDDGQRVFPCRRRIAGTVG